MQKQKPAFCHVALFNREMGSKGQGKREMNLKWRAGNGVRLELKSFNSTLRYPEVSRLGLAIYLTLTVPFKNALALVHPVSGRDWIANISQLYNYKQ